MTGEEPNCTQCVQARNFERLAEDQKLLSERGVKRDEALAAVKLDTAVTVVKVTHLADVTNDIKVSIKDFHDSSNATMKEVQASIKAVESQPGQNWRDLIKVIITVCMTSIITAIALSITAK